MPRHQHVLTLLQASQSSPTLARLSELASDSKARLKAVEFLIPTGLRAYVAPGPIDGPVWCLLLSSTSAAAKLRQLLPAMEAHLRVKGWDVNSIRIKVQAHRPL
ncbi:hypothetical protein [Rhodoferax sp. PAMC 29310]|uniref:hypothetical protein n=1 Tax=Rhodoferax sp. PAMC 29310 TaxID=2822760 RepID=UPI001F0A597E|nr:hypothetical protein [Rhodoferax sp. PAMC 29310]